MDIKGLQYTESFKKKKIEEERLGQISFIHHDSLTTKVFSFYFIEFRIRMIIILIIQMIIQIIMNITMAMSSTIAA